MNQEVIEILKEIKSEEHLEMLLPQKINSSLKTLGKSLFEISLLAEGDFLKINGLGKTKFRYLIEFNKQIQNDPKFIMSFKKHVLDAPQILPNKFDSNKSLASNLLHSVSDFAIILEERVELPFSFFGKTEHNSYNKLYQYINNYFGLNNLELLSFDEIADKLQVNSETVRTNLFDYKNRPDLVDLFLENQIGYGVQINPILINNCKKLIIDNLYRPHFFENFTFELEEISDLQLARILEIFNCEVVKIDFEGSNLIYKTIVTKNGDEIGEFKAYFRLFDSILRDGNLFSYELLKKEISDAIDQLPNKPYNRTIKKNGFNETMFNAILENYFKIEAIAEDELISYQFKWHYLSSQIAKSTRILFENDGVMSKEEILEEFHIRENELGLEITIESIDYLHIKATDKIHPIGKTGNWFFEENYTEAKNTLAERVSSDISQKFNGKIHFDEFIEFSNSVDFYSHYENSAIRTNIFLCCRPTVNDKNLFVHNDFIEQFPQYEIVPYRNKYVGNTIAKIIIELFKNNDQEIEKNQLYNEIVEKLSFENIELKTKRNILQYLNKFNEIGILNFTEKNNITFIQLNQNEINNLDLDKIGKKQEPEYKKLIRAKTITILKGKTKIKLSEVFEIVKDIAPAEISKTNIYKIFNDTSLFIKETIDNDLWISLDTQLLPAPQEMHIEVFEDTTDLLGSKPLPQRIPFDAKELQRAIMAELEIEKNTYGLNNNIIFETFESFTEIVLDNERNSIWGKTLVQSIFENFCTKTDIYDRQICVMNLVGSYETFLKIISPIDNQVRTSGIVEIIQSIPEINDLYYYKQQDKHFRTNKQKENFSYILNRAKYYADLYRHDRSHEDLSMGNTKMMKFIVDFTALYLYTLYLVDRY
jgi:hypothetical protein